MVAGTNIKQLQNSIEIRKCLVQKFGIISISLLCKYESHIRVPSMYSATVINRRWLRPVNFTLKALLAP
jgi:hypothetical protein